MLSLSNTFFFESSFSLFFFLLQSQMFSYCKYLLLFLPVVGIEPAKWFHFKKKKKKKTLFNQTLYPLHHVSTHPAAVNSRTYSLSVPFAKFTIWYMHYQFRPKYQLLRFLWPNHLFAFHSYRKMKNLGNLFIYLFFFFHFFFSPPARRGNYDLADHYMDRGDLSNASKSYARLETTVPLFHISLICV